MKTSTDSGKSGENLLRSFINFAVPLSTAKIELKEHGGGAILNTWLSGLIFTR